MMFGCLKVVTQKYHDNLFSLATPQDLNLIIPVVLEQSSVTFRAKLGMLRPRLEPQVPLSRSMSTTVKHVLHGGQKMVSDASSRDGLVKVRLIRIIR